MAGIAEPDPRPRGSIDFAETSILDTIVPLANDLDIEEALSGSVERLDEGSDSPLATIPQRSSLFFGKTNRAFIVVGILLMHRYQMKP